jgi:hypothetical protein
MFCPLDVTVGGETSRGTAGLSMVVSTVRSAGQGSLKPRKLPLLMYYSSVLTHRNTTGTPGEEGGGERESESESEREREVMTAGWFTSG